MKQKQHTKLAKESEQALEPPSGLVYVKVSPSTQQLQVLCDDQILQNYTIATATNGLGEEKNSFKTPRGWHMIRAKIGAEHPPNAIFKRRRFTGDIYSPEMDLHKPGQDWILTRILWLSGLEPGFNRLGNVDTMQRFVYIHGTPDTRPVGVPSSRGCIRMQNQDIIQLFDLVSYGTRVLIEHN